MDTQHCYGCHSAMSEYFKLGHYHVSDVFRLTVASIEGLTSDAKAIQQICDKVAKGQTAPPPVVRQVQRVIQYTNPPKRQTSHTASSNGNGTADLGKCERAILQVLSQFPDGCESGKLTLLTGYRYSGGFKNSLSSLRQAGLIHGDNTSTMRITETGLSLGPFDPMPEGQDLIDYWLTHRSFGQCERTVLAALVEHRHGLTAEQICERTGYQYSGGFKNALSNLRTAGVIVGRNTEVMKASDTLFK